MKFTPEETATIASYNKTSEEWLIDKQKPDFWLSEFQTFQRYLPNGTILEVGSGSGRDAKLFIDADYQYIGTDVSSKLLENAKKLNPKGNFYERSLYDMEFDDNTFDGFWMAATFLHIPKKRAKAALLELKRVMRPNSVGFISVKLGRGEEMTVHPRKGRRLFAYYDQEELSKLLSESGFLIVESNIHSFEDVDWLCFWVTATKP